ncbi:MAG: DUF6172 family protein [Thiomicrorhabdus chilensis]|uniref:DUF6172 family protein n=1 Tax=Thiomicrorhabdus chilensis TaxID=63656 RepID=UPI00299DAD64|nr:DUF6172 family protein [Thiomicrorhabdus chilensis]MDX1347020.1 DUF6172 family protein [Thiomicrorhabdus chilensis]
MRKTFTLTHEKIAPARRVEAIKHEVKKYIKRERNKALPKGADFWDFDCRFGSDQESSVVIHVAEIDQHINQAETDNLQSFYLEILAKPGVRVTRPQEDKPEPEAEFE